MVATFTPEDIEESATVVTTTAGPVWRWWLEREQELSEQALEDSHQPGAREQGAREQDREGAPGVAVSESQELAASQKARLSPSSSHANAKAARARFIGPIWFNASRDVARVGGRFVPLTATESLILQTLARDVGREFTPHEIATRSSGVSEYEIAAAIFPLTEKIAPAPGGMNVYRIHVGAQGYTLSTRAVYTDLAYEACLQLIELGAFSRLPVTADRQIHNAAEKLLVWFQEWIGAGDDSGDEKQLTILGTGKRYLLSWTALSGLMLREQPHSVDEARLVDGDAKRQRAIERLADALAMQGGAGGELEMAGVYAALKRYHDLAEPLPAGVSDTIITFLAQTAARCGWEPLAAKDTRVPGLILAAYLTDESLERIGERYGAITGSRVSQLVSWGIDILWDGLPMPHARKEREFPREQLRRSRTGRGGETNREAAFKRWQYASYEQRMRWLDTINLATSTPESRAKQSTAARERMAHTRRDSERDGEHDAPAPERQRRWGAGD